MNTSTLALAVAFVAANASAADPRTDIALDPVTVSGARVVVDCSHVRLPSHQAVADLIDSNNISLIQSGPGCRFQPFIYVRVVKTETDKRAFHLPCRFTQIVQPSCFCR